MNLNSSLHAAYTARQGTRTHYASQRFIGRIGGVVPSDALGGLGASGGPRASVSGRESFQFGVHSPDQSFGVHSPDPSNLHALATCRHGAEEERASRARSQRADIARRALLIDGTVRDDRGRGEWRRWRGRRGRARRGLHVGEGEMHGGADGQVGSAGGGAVPLREIGEA